MFKFYMKKHKTYSLTRNCIRGLLKFSLFTLLLAFCLSMTAAAMEPLRVISVSDAPRDSQSGTGSDAFLNHLESGYKVSLKHVNISEAQPSLTALEDGDVIFLHLQGPIPQGQWEPLRVLVESGRPLVGLRAAAHAFGQDSGVDREVFGAHYGKPFESGLTTRTRPTPAGSNHPIFDGVGPIRSLHNLYRFEKFSDDTEALLIGAVPGSPPETLAWTRGQGERRVFYSSLGGEHDFENDSVKRMIANALFWTANRDPQRKPLPDIVPWQRKQGTLVLPLQSRQITGDGDAGSITIKTITMPIQFSALIVSDIFDTHWCPSIATQMNELAEKVNALISIAREGGMLIVHAPSWVQGFYDKHPARRRVEGAVSLTVEGNYPIEPEPIRNTALPPMPISNANCPSGGAPYAAWTRQHPAIEIHETDIISNIGRQIYGYLLISGIDTVFYVGTHANTTMVEHSFGMRQMVEWGMECVLIRDMTDIIFDAQSAPQMSHETALQKVIAHLETHLAPTISSQQLIDAIEKGRQGSNR